MATRDRFPPSNPVPLVISDHAEEAEQSGKAWDAIISSRIAKMVVSVFMAAAIVFAIAIVGNPIVLFVTASEVSASGQGPVNALNSIKRQRSGFAAGC